MKKALAILTLVSVLSLSLAGLAGASLDSAYFNVNKRSVEQLVSVWGQPDKIAPQDNGTEVYVYGESGMEATSNRYFVVKDGVVIDGGTNFRH